jgi:hypothetical protein
MNPVFRRTLRLALLATLYLPFTAAAQQIPHSGDRVRLDGVIGTFLRLSPDTVTISAGGRPLDFPLQRITRFEISQGERSHGLLGAGIGLVVGSGIAYLIVHSGGSTSLCDRNVNQDAIGSLECAGVVALGATIGAGLGYIIGGRIHTERWTRIPVERLRVTVGSAGPGLAVALTF